MSERLGWLVLRAVNRAQAKDSTVRLVAPRDPEIVEQLGRELGLGPTDEELLSAENYLLEHGYIAPTGIGIARDVYTVTLAGLDWLDTGLAAPRGTSQRPSEEAARMSEATHGAPEPLGGRQQRAEDAGSIVVLRGSGTDFCKSWSSSACESNIWRRSWGGAARLGTGDGSVDAKGDMASMARG